MREETVDFARDGRPAFSVVVLAYRSLHRIDTALRSLRAQRLEQPFEVIVVDSGDDGCADYIRAVYPEVRLVRSDRRLWPGAARNRGVAVARGEYVAFLADDCAACPEWLARRMAKHKEGFAAVGGAVTNATPLHPVGSADYLLEYAPLLPSDRILARQRVPHSVSYTRELLSRVAPFPEDTRTGEDTVLNERIVSAGVAIGHDCRVQVAHRNLTRVMPFLRHHFAHGRGLMQCVAGYGFVSRTGPIEQSPARALVRIFARYPAGRWWRGLKETALGGPSFLLRYLALAPLLWAGLWAVSAGAWAEWQRLASSRRCAPLPQAALTASSNGDRPQGAAPAPAQRNSVST